MKAATATPHLPTDIEHIATDALIPYARNSRTHSPEQVAQLAASIREFGFTNPVLIDEHDTIIAGHGRVMAAQQIGLTHVPCIRLSHLSAAQRRAYVIADNKLAEQAGWDTATLSRELEDLAAESFDLALLGFGEDELRDLLGDTSEHGDGGGLSDPDETPDPEPDPVSQPGDVWLLGHHRVMCGDSTQSASVATVMGGGMADLWITDPPYNVGYEGKSKKRLSIENDDMASEQFMQFLVAAFTAARDALKPGGAFYIWHADVEGATFRVAAAAAGLRQRQCLIWKKNVMVLGRQDYQWIHEPCLYGWKDGAAHRWTSDRKQVTVLEFDRPMRNAEHPTMKPVALIEYQLCNNSMPGDVVFDGFGGSGTTLIAAEKSGRVARLIELDPRYCDVIVRRWQAYTARDAVHAPSGQTFAQRAAEPHPEPSA